MEDPPPWNIGRLRPPLCTLERRLSSLQARRGLSRSPRAAPETRRLILPPRQLAVDRPDGHRGGAHLLLLRGHLPVHARRSSTFGGKNLAPAAPGEAPHAPCLVRPECSGRPPQSRAQASSPPTVAAASREPTLARAPRRGLRHFLHHQAAVDAHTARRHTPREVRATQCSAQLSPSIHHVTPRHPPTHRSQANRVYLSK